MNQPKKKLIRGCLLFLLLVGLFSVFVFFANTSVYVIHNMESRGAQMKALSQTVEKQLALEFIIEQDVIIRNVQKTALGIFGSQDEMLEKAGGKPCSFKNGAIIKAENGAVEMPDECPKELQLDMDQLTEEEGIIYSHPFTDKESGESAFYIVNYFHVQGPLYYIEWTESTAFFEECEKYSDSENTMAGIEQAFNVNILLFSAEANEDGTHVLTYRSNLLPEYRTVEEFGITEEMLSKAVENYDNMTMVDIAGAYNTLTVDGTSYELFLQKLDSTVLGSKTCLAYLIPLEQTGLLLWEQTAIVFGAFLIIGIFFLVWFHATMLLVRDHNLSGIQKKEVEPRAIRRRAFSILGIGSAVILTVSALLFALFQLYSISRQVDSGLLSLERRIAENKDQISLNEASQMENYKEYAVLTARMLEQHPEIAKEEYLQDICDMIEADYLMLFDSEGNETLSNSRYVGISLGQDPSSPTYDFRRLLNGTPLIAHEAAMDEAADEKNVLIGVSFGNPEEGEKYGALLMAVPVEQIYNSFSEDVSDIMSSIVSEGMLSFSVEPESKIILETSDSALLGADASYAGLPERAFIGGYQDFFTIDGLRCYGKCEEIDGILYYYAVTRSHIYQRVLPYSLAVSAAAFVLLAILAIYLIRGYRKYFETWSEVGEKIDDSGNDIEVSGGRLKLSIDPSKRWKSNVIEYGIHAPMHVASLTLWYLLFIFIAISGISVLSAKFGSSESMIAFILQGNWAKGINLFAFISILILFAEVVFAVALTRFLLKLISDAHGTKGETICKLLINITNYAGVIFFIYFSLYFLGFKPNTLLASLGLMSFAISLGAKDLITDVIAGLSIVFEGEYQVGDIIEVGGYRGEVLEIGVRTTKLEGRGGNIKIIGNRDIKNVVNMTRYNSWYPLEISIPNEQSLPEVEQLLDFQLPLIGESIPEIVSGPYYKGVISINKGVTTLSIIAECNESDYFYVQRALNRAVRETFEAHNIKFV